MTEIEKAYIAGIVDGEGCLSFSKRQGNSGYLTPTVQITNTEWSLINWLETLIHGYIDIRNDKRPNRKQAYCWRLAGCKAREFIREIYPYLRIKKAQADLILNYRLCPPVRDENGRLKRTLTPTIKEQRHILLKQMRDLNKRGIA